MTEQKYWHNLHEVSVTFIWTHRTTLSRTCCQLIRKHFYRDANRTPAPATRDFIKAPHLIGQRRGRLGYCVVHRLPVTADSIRTLDRVRNGQSVRRFARIVEWPTERTRRPTDETRSVLTVYRLMPGPHGRLVTKVDRLLTEQLVAPVKPLVAGPDRRQIHQNLGVKLATGVGGVRVPRVVRCHHHASTSQ